MGMKAAIELRSHWFKNLSTKSVFSERFRNRLDPRIKCVLMECTELSQFSDDIRAATGLPVYDAVTGCDTCMTAFQDNDRFGKDAWYMIDEIKEQPLDGEFSTPEERDAIDARVDKIIAMTSESHVFPGVCKPCRV